MRIFAKGTLLLLLISIGFTVCSCIGPPPRHRRYVTRAQITLYQGGQPQTRIYQQPKKINSVLNFLRTTRPRGKADPDAFAAGSHSYHITLHYCDGTQSDYGLQEYRYFYGSNGLWQKVSPSHAQMLYLLIHLLPSDQ